MLVCLAFKANATIGGASVEYQAIDPLREVEQVETDIQQLSHLRRVNLLVIDCVRCGKLLPLRAKITPKRLIAANPLKGIMLL